MLFCSSAAAQHPYYYNLNEENGLPSNETYRIAQDSQGYMWMGCSAGLYRYNGTGFKAYTNPAANSKSISGLCFDKAGKLWCYNFTGQILYVKNDSLHLFKDYSRVCKSYPRFTFDQEGNMWVTADQLIEVFSPGGKLLRTLSGYTDKQKKAVQWVEIEKDQDGIVYIHSTTNGLWKCKGVNGQLMRVSIDEQEKTMNNRGAFRFFNKQLYLIIEINPERRYEIWLIGRSGIECVGKPALIHPNDIAYSITADNRGQVMLLTSSGVIRADKNYRQTRQTVLFPDEKISDMIVDREGNYWFSSLQNGVMVIPSIDLEIYNSRNSALADDNISSLKATGTDELLLGTYKGSLHRFSIPDGKASLYMHNDPSVYRHVRKIKTYKGKTFVARGCFSILSNNHEDVLRLWNARDFDFMDDSLYFVLSDQVMSSKAGAGVAATQRIRARGASAIVCDSVTHSIYFACNDGLFKRKNGRLSEIRNQQQPVYATSLQMLQRELWIGTISEGVLIYDLTNGRILRKVDVTSGICSNNIRSIKTSEAGVWVVTEKCLTLIRPDAGIHSFSFAEGLLSKQINAIEVIHDTAWIATNKGLIRMPVTMQSSNRIAPLVGITGFFVNDQFKKAFGELRLPWNQNDIRICFEGLALRSRGSFFYKYRLSGNDTGWTLAGSEGNTVRYNTVAPGEYRFEVICINEDGMESLPATVLFSVAPPYWQSWWFYVLLLAAVSACVYLLFNIRLRILKKRADEQNQLVLSQLTALKAQMNPHFMYNTLNSIQDLMIHQDIKNTNYYLSQFASLMRKVLDASGDDEILIGEEIDILSLYLTLEKLRFGTQFTFGIETDPAIDKERIFIPSMIIQPFVENAIKHGLLHKRGPKLLNVSFRLETGKLICMITDNGVGRQKAAEIKARGGNGHRSFATSATEKRLALINKSRQQKITLEISDLEENGMPSGTSVRITIPLNPL